MKRIILMCCLLLFSASYGQEIVPPKKTTEIQSPKVPKTTTDLPKLPNDFLEELEKGSSEQDSHFMKEFLNMLFVLGIMIAALFLLTWFMKRMMHGKVTHMNRSSTIKIMEQRSLSNKTTLYILEIAGKSVVVAESQNGVSLVTELPERSFSNLMNEKEEK